MRTALRCLLLALLIAGLGVGLRHALPVAPVDGAFEAVLRAYATPGSGAPSGAGDHLSNTTETSSP